MRWRRGRRRQLRLPVFGLRQGSGVLGFRKGGPGPFSTIRGAEMELTALPVNGVKVFATGGYTNAVYNKFTAALATNAYNPSESPEQTLDRFLDGRDLFKTDAD
jgi:hypothetical protein